MRVRTRRHGVFVAAVAMAIISCASARNDARPSDDETCVVPDGEVFFPEVPDVIPFLGPDTDEPFAFRHYNESEVVAGKTMKEWLRFSVAFWHTIRNDGSDPFGAPTKRWPWDAQCDDPMRIAKRRMRALFELMRKLGVDLWCFHDRDIAPVGATLQETNANLDEIAEYALSLQRGTSIRPLWGTAQLFSEPHYMLGASTSPRVDVFVRAGAQVKKAMDVTHKLGGEAFNFWGGREGYAHLATTDLAAERARHAAFLRAARAYWVSIGGTGPLLIEPKPQEPSKHQYDWDVATTAGFLREFSLEDSFRLNVECNHATLAGHSCAHEVASAVATGALGGIDANTGDPQVGWDTDQFMTDHREAPQVLLPLVRAGGAGLAPGGVNFDAKLRRESTDVNDLVHAHVGGMDAFARGLKIAAELARPDGALERLRLEKYAEWSSSFGRRVEAGEVSFEEMEKIALGSNRDPVVASGQQEFADNIIARAS